MFHKKCGGELILDCSSSYVIQSPSIQITTKGIIPGVIEITSNKNKGCSKLICSQCQQTFSSKTEFEEDIVENCIFCKKEYPTEEIKIFDNMGAVCIHCIEKSTSIKSTTTSIKEKMLLYYGEIIKRGYENPTLLTILMKK